MRLLALLLCIVTFVSCRTTPDEPPLFESLNATQTGVGFINRVIESPQLNIIDYLYFYNGGGVSAGDVNNDGLTDLYFVSNWGVNRLYLNRTKPGEKPHFDDITEKADVGGQSEWQTGTTMADVNGDGRLDIYVCAVSGFRTKNGAPLKGHNELYINNGPGPDGVPTFTEQAEAYGLDFAGFSTQAAFFDYDHDNDLDCFLLNHAVHSVRSYDRITARDQPDSLAGDFLYRNEGRVANGSQPKTTLGGNTPPPVSFRPVASSGIFRAPMGYGLGVAVADFNSDGWEDIYVSNDFHEDDYLYLNNQRGGFDNVAPQQLAHTSRFSMGNDAADINHDGRPDLVTLDMYPDDETVEKASAGEDPYDIYQYKLAYGYMNQYSRNCLQINQGNGRFADVAALAGVAATDWSWSPLLADYDLDGQTDLFIANGIARRPNDLDYVKYISNDSVQMALGNAQGNSAKALTKAIEIMPEGKVHNYLFRGTAEGRFDDKSAAWGFKTPNCANGATYADLDNDGDLDLITNNLNEAASIYLNQTNTLFPQRTYLRVRLEGSGANTAGIGARVLVRYAHSDSLQMQQLMPTRGFESSVEPRLTFGLGTSQLIDSLIVIWPDQQMEVRRNVRVNQQVVLKQTDAKLDGRGYVISRPGAPRVFAQLAAADTTALPYRHRENTYYLDFSRESLMPFKVSTEGPRLAVGDVNGDGLDDVYAGGARNQPGTLLLQTPTGRFVASPQPVMAADSVSEDVDALFFDADGDRDLDLYVVSGGNEFSRKDPPLLDRLYLNNGTTGGQPQFSKATLPLLMGNKSCVRAADLDADGDLDLFVGGRVLANQYGQTPDSYLLINDGRGPGGLPRFTVATDERAPGLRQAGMITDARWTDLNNDRQPDLVVVGDWMAPRVFLNQKGQLTEAKNLFGDAPMRGLWQCLAAADFDRDGDIDLMAGNLGLNTKFRKNAGGQLRMWVKDVDGNQTTDQLVAYNRPVQIGPDSYGNLDEWYPVATKDELGKQMPSIINKRYVTYRSIAGKLITDIFTANDLANAEERTVDQFASVYLINNGPNAGEAPTFTVQPLPMLAQVSKVFALTPFDIDDDGDLDLLGGGNFYGVSPYQGRYDASNGFVLRNEQGRFTALSPADTGFLLSGEIRSIVPVRGRLGTFVLVGRNNERTQLFGRVQPATRPKGS
ncbi:ASPIC/UnbV domain protein [Fibrella aestuarina BUZ 2]|uniref:ASPIC/UnbV domain protein n=1 Tax=Fibrella aestuarina BUZ 2 TaxID=1166018 RepID=I0K4D4_9BACT|nr:VCBS repeat-containing protein [Fibrella aestuarina]CCG98987.1 ASPIC/UnbV domain protein [Fibrella aestuarina BUZ 2]